MFSWSLEANNYRVHFKIAAKCGPFNPLPHDKAFWHCWNIMYLKILWKMKHLLFWSKCCIFQKYFQKYSKLYLNFLDFLKMLSKNRKWCHDLKIAYGLNEKSTRLDSKGDMIHILAVPYIGVLSLLFFFHFSTSMELTLCVLGNLSFFWRLLIFKKNASVSDSLDSDQAWHFDLGDLFAKVISRRH